MGHITPLVARAAEATAATCFAWEFRFGDGFLSFIDWFHMEPLL